MPSSQIWAWGLAHIWAWTIGWATNIGYLGREVRWGDGKINSQTHCDKEKERKLQCAWNNSIYGKLHMYVRKKCENCSLKAGSGNVWVASDPDFVPQDIYALFKFFFTISRYYLYNHEKNPVELFSSWKNKRESMWLLEILWFVLLVHFVTQALKNRL